MENKDNKDNNQTKETFTNYSMMLGITDRMSTETLKSEIERYETAAKQVNSRLREVQEKNSFFTSNITGLKKMLKEREDRELRKNFVLRKEHLLLLGSMDFRGYEGDYVFLGVDGKRPFGNSNIEQDVADICGLDEDDEMIEQLLYELPFAINYIFSLDLMSSDLIRHFK